MILNRESTVNVLICLKQIFALYIAGFLSASFYTWKIQVNIFLYTIFTLRRFFEKRLTFLQSIS